MQFKCPLRTVFIDLELSPCVGWFWRTGKQQITIENILDHQKIICITWAWNDSKEVHSLVWDKEQDDKQLLLDFIGSIQDAECVIGHNGKNFDLKILNARIAYHQLKKQIPLMMIEDTLLLARRSFNLPSFKLDYLLNYFKVGKKIKVHADLWIDVVFKKDKKALARMVEYCMNDTLQLKTLYKRIRDYLPSQQNYAVVNEDTRICPNCKGKIQFQGWRVTRLGKYQRYSCSTCGKWGHLGNRMTANSASYPRGE